MPTVTPGAAATIRRVLDENPEAAGLRIQVESGGCAGLRYGMGLEAEADPSDRVVEVGGVRIFLDPDSARMLIGAVVDFVENEEGAGFRFDNPNAFHACSSCGSSPGASGCSIGAR